MHVKLKFMYFLQTIFDAVEAFLSGRYMLIKKKWAVYVNISVWLQSKFQVFMYFQIFPG